MSQQANQYGYFVPPDFLGGTWENKLSPMNNLPEDYDENGNRIWKLYMHGTAMNYLVKNIKKRNDTYRNIENS